MKTKLLLTAIVMTFFGALNAQNLLVNGDLETIGAGGSHTFDGWTGVDAANVRQELTYAISGLRSCRFASLTSAVTLTQDVTVEEGQTYDISFTGRIQDSHAATGTVSSTNRILICQVRAGTDTGDWTEIATATTANDETKTGSYTVPAGITTVRFQMKKTDGIAYFDNLSMVKRTSTSVKGEFAAKTYAYPNPTSGITELSSDDVITSYSLFNSTGQLLETLAVNQASVQVDLSAYANGLYIISTTDATGSIQVLKLYKK